MDSKLLDKLYEEIKADEGEVLSIYKDHLGYDTFGIGHLVTEQDPEHGQPEGTPISQGRVQAAFAIDIQKSIYYCEAQYNQWNNWPEEVRLIMVNMMFNMGPTRMAKFKNMHSALSMQDWKQAAAEGRDSLWYRQVTNRAERLMSRLEKV
jgi:lysozyme